MWNFWLIRLRGNTSISTSSSSVFSQFFQYSIKLRFDGRQDVGELTALRLGQTPQHVGLDLACHVVQPLVNLPALGSKNKDHVATALTSWRRATYLCLSKRVTICESWSARMEVPTPRETV